MVSYNIFITLVGYTAAASSSAATVSQPINSQHSELLNQGT